MSPGFSLRPMRYRRRGPPRGGPSSWAPRLPRPTMPWRRSRVGLGLAADRDSAGRWSSPELRQAGAGMGVVNLQWVHGRDEEGVAEAARPVEMDPLAAVSRSMFALALSGFARHHEAGGPGPSGRGARSRCYLLGIVLPQRPRTTRRATGGRRWRYTARRDLGAPVGVEGQAVQADWGKRRSAGSGRGLRQTIQQEYVQPTAPRW